MVSQPKKMSSGRSTEKKKYIFAVLILVTILFTHFCFAEGTDSSIKNNIETVGISEPHQDFILNLEKSIDNYKAQNTASIDLLKSDIANLQQGLNLFYKDKDYFKGVLESEKYQLDQGERMLGLLCQVFSLFIALISCAFVVIAFLGFRNLREMKNEAELAREKYLGQSQEIIEKVMRSSCDKTITELSNKIYRLETFNEFLRMFLENKGKVTPSNLPKDEDGEGNQEPENPFEQP